MMNLNYNVSAAMRACWLEHALVARHVREACRALMQNHRTRQLQLLVLLMQQQLLLMLLMLAAAGAAAVTSRCATLKATCIKRDMAFYRF